MKLAHKLRAQAVDVDIVPGVNSTLLSGVNFSDVDYVTILDKGVINIYYVKTTKIIISYKVVLSGYCTEEGLWRIPMKKNVQNFNTDTFMIQYPLSNKAISNLFELPSTDKTISYYHVATGFPTK